MEALAQHSDCLACIGDLEEMIEIAQWPDAAVNVGALVLRIQDHDTDLLHHQPTMLSVEKIGYDEGGGQHPTLQFVDAGDFVRAEAALDVDDVGELRFPVQQDQVRRVGLTPTGIGVEGQRPEMLWIVFLDEFKGGLGNR